MKSDQSKTRAELILELQSLRKRVNSGDITDREQAEKALRESEERYKKLFNLTFEGILIHNKGVAIDLNRSLEKMFGYSRKEMIGKNLIELLVPREFHSTIQENIIKESAKPYEVMARKKDGTLFPIEIEARDVKSKNKEFRVTAFRDITERKQAAETLENSELKFRLLADYTYDWIYWIGLDGIYIYLSPSCKRITGYGPEEFISNPELFHEIIRHDYADKVHQHIKDESNLQESIISMEFPIITKTGEECWVEHNCSPVFDDQGKFFGRRGNNRNITERKQAEAALRDSESQNKLLIENAHESIISISNDGKLLLLNKAAAAFLGGAPEDFIGKTVWDIFPKEVADTRMTDNWAVIQSGKSQTMEHSLSFQGKTHWFLTSRQAIRGSSGDMFVLNISKDITERKRTEEMLGNQRIQLEQKNIALREFMVQLTEEKKRLGDQVVANITTLIKPQLNRLKTESTESQKGLLDLIEHNLEIITSSFGFKLSREMLTLSPREIEICNMIKQGLSSKEIARLLNIAEPTVTRHRNNIRNKLGIRKTATNLNTYLNSI